MSEIKLIKCKHCGCDPLKPTYFSSSRGYITRCRNEQCAFHYVDFRGNTEEEAYLKWNAEQAGVDIKYQAIKELCDEYILKYDELLSQVRLIKEDIINYKGIIKEKDRMIERLREKYESNLKITEEYRQQYCEVLDENEELHDELAMLNEELREYKDLVRKFKEVDYDIIRLVDKLTRED